MTVIYTDTQSLAVLIINESLTPWRDFGHMSLKLHCRASIHIHNLEVDQVPQINEHADSIISAHLPAVQSSHASTTLPLRQGCKPVQLEEASKISRRTIAPSDLCITWRWFSLREETISYSKYQLFTEVRNPNAQWSQWRLHGSSRWIQPS